MAILARLDAHKDTALLHRNQDFLGAFLLLEISATPEDICGEINIIYLPSTRDLLFFSLRFKSSRTGCAFKSAAAQVHNPQLSTIKKILLYMLTLITRNWKIYRRKRLFCPKELPAYYLFFKLLFQGITYDSLNAWIFEETFTPDLICP